MFIQNNEDNNFYFCNFFDQNLKKSEIENFFKKFELEFSDEKIKNLSFQRYELDKKKTLFPFFELYNFIYLISIQFWLESLFFENELKVAPFNSDLNQFVNRDFNDLTFSNWPKTQSINFFRKGSSIFQTISKNFPIQNVEGMPSNLDALFFSSRRLQKKIFLLKNKKNQIKKSDSDSLFYDYNSILKRVLEEYRIRKLRSSYLHKSVNFWYYWNFEFDKLLHFDRRFSLTLALLFNISKRLKKLAQEVYNQ